MSFNSVLRIIRAGYKSHLRGNRIFLDEYYTAEKNERQKYDLVIPKSAKGKLGLVLCIHGGGWVEGRKESYTKNFFQFSEKKGVAAASINYRYVSESVNYGDLLDDITAALKAIKAKGAEYGVEFDKVIFTGISAGGHLSLLYAYTRKDTAPIKPVAVVELCGPTDLENPFFCSKENRVGASVGTEYFRKIISNGIGFEIDLENYGAAAEYMKKYSPVNFIDENTVPTVFGHGEIDDIVPYQNALDLDGKLTEHNVEHIFISFPNSNHECEDKDSFERYIQLSYEYIDTYLF